MRYAISKALMRASNSSTKRINVPTKPFFRQVSLIRQVQADQLLDNAYVSAPIRTGNVRERHTRPLLCQNLFNSLPSKFSDWPIYSA